MSVSGGQPFADIGGRMAVFGKLFSDQVGVHEIGGIAEPRDVVALVQSRVPSSPVIEEETPVFEAAAFVGEWLRARVGAEWVSEGPFEPHIQVADRSHAVVYLLPLVTILRTASTAGYDGVSALLERVVQDSARGLGPMPLDELPVYPREDRAIVVAWIRKHLDVRDAMRAGLWRRCSACSKMAEDALELQNVGTDWEAEAGTAAAVLAKRPFRCACGGLPGEVARFVMMRHVDGVTRFGDIYVGGNHTRVGCWTVASPQVVVPYDALALAKDEPLANG